MTQENIILNLIERICRSNIYLFIISRNLIGKYLSKIIFDSDFKIIKILVQKGYFKKNSLVLDIGANDGMSYKIIRKFAKKTKIISCEPIYHNYRILKKFEGKDKLFECFNIGLSNKLKKLKLFIPYFKKFSLTQMAGLDKDGVKNRLKQSLFIKDILKKIQFKKKIIKTRKLDSFKLKPTFIKIDIEGHEYECILGSLKTIKKICL